MRIFIITIFYIVNMYTLSFGISYNFLHLINIMEVDQYNIDGYEINEEVYYKYNQIVYGSPEKAINEPTQRWKRIITGRWTRDGEKGEYRILGYNILGDIVNNHEFPMDIIPSSSPLDWTYVKVLNGENSWNNLQSFKFIEQKDYMQNTNLYRNGIKYEINAIKIGLDKARIENPSTWKSSGTIYTNRVDPYGKVWEATFITPPMANNASLSAYIKPIPHTYHMTMFMDYIDVYIEYGANIINVNEYMNPSHVKNITLDMYIDDGRDSRRTTSNSFLLIENHPIRIYRASYENDPYERTYSVNLKLRSSATTNFLTDGPMYSNAETSFNIIVYPRFVGSHYIPPVEPPFRPKLDENNYIIPEFDNDEDNLEAVEDIENNEIDIRKLLGESQNEKMYELHTCKDTVNKSLGFVSAGQWIGIKLNTSKNTKLVKVNLNLNSTVINLNLKPNAVNSIYTGYLKIPYEINQTLHSWNSLREKFGNSFNFENICNRIANPYIIEFEVYKEIKTENSTTIILEKIERYLDIFERWDRVYNRDITPYILNKTKNIVSKDVWENY